MGTRSLTYVYNDETPMLCLYRQFDGYPSGHGAQVAEFLQGRTIVNGYGTGTPEKASNGMGCLAASLIGLLKEGIGNIYVYPIELGQDAWQDYEYHIYENRVVVKNPTEVIFEGNYDSFVTFCSEDE